jgi:hypothetical protein
MPRTSTQVRARLPIWLDPRAKHDDGVCFLRLILSTSAVDLTAYEEKRYRACHEHEQCEHKQSMYDTPKHDAIIALVYRIRQIAELRQQPVSGRDCPIPKTGY